MTFKISFFIVWAISRLFLQNYESLFFSWFSRTLSSLGVESTCRSNTLNSQKHKRLQRAVPNQSDTISIHHFKSGVGIEIWKLHLQSISSFTWLPLDAPPTVSHFWGYWRSGAMCIPHILPIALNAFSVFPGFSMKLSLSRRWFLCLRNNRWYKQKYMEYIFIYLLVGKSSKFFEM